MGTNWWVLYFIDWPILGYEFDDNVTYSENSIVDHKIIELKGNFIPKGISSPWNIIF